MNLSKNERFFVHELDERSVNDAFKAQLLIDIEECIASDIRVIVYFYCLFSVPGLTCACDVRSLTVHDAPTRLKAIESKMTTKTSKDEFSVYTGYSGLALVFFMVGNKARALELIAGFVLFCVCCSCLININKILDAETILNATRTRRKTLWEGAAGVYCVKWIITRSLESKNQLVSFLEQARDSFDF